MLSEFINRIRSLWYFFLSFFPVQLFLLHLRRSQLLIIFWLLLVGFISGGLAESYGLRYLFLTPEYLDKVSFFSYFLIGITAGLFTMAFHINSYIYYSYRYPFLATLEKPLLKYSLNNSLIPLLFYAFYIYRIIEFSIDEEYASGLIATNVASLLLGSILIISITFSYFFNTIKTLEDVEGRKSPNPLKSLAEIIKVDNKLKDPGTNRVNYYLRTPLSISIARPSSHYKKQVLLETIRQHHFSASLLFVILLMLLTGLSFSDSRVFTIPAGATVFLIFATYLMIIGALYSRLKTWTITIGVLALLVLNYLSGMEPFKGTNYAYGMNYEVPKARYNYEVLDSLTSNEIVDQDVREARQVLEAWRSKVATPGQKPRMIILNVSGGGQRSALWTLDILQQLDVATGGGFYPHVHLITGSSGGMLGAAFYRQLKYLRSTGVDSIDPNEGRMRAAMGKDLLNPVCFTLAVNDLFFRMRDIQYDGREYTMDRGYSFDRKFSQHTFGLLDHHYGYYRELERSAEVPILILGPSIVGDGRKLLMSTQGVSYLTFTRPYEGIRKEKEYDGVEFSRFFRRQEADNLSFLTALRMSASFPYITPLVNMPSDPSIELIDAGVRDNEGFELALRYVYQHEEWLRKNTSGVMIIQLKANRPDEIPIRDAPVSRIDRLILPIGGVFKSFSNFQIYNKSLLMQLSRDETDLPLEVVRFSLFNEEDKVSLSWHLTNDEKKSIEATFENKVNQEALEDFLNVFGTNNKKPVAQK